MTTPLEHLRGSLRGLPALVRLGLSAMLLTMLLGMVTSGMVLHHHYQNRDERPGLTLDDITAAYSGLESKSPMLRAVESKHPPELEEKSREILRSWLTGGKVSENYDNLDLGDAAPAEIIAKNCLSCHARNTKTPPADDVSRKLPLESWDDVKKVAFSRKFDPTPAHITAISTHTHALSLGLMGLVLALMMLGTRWPRGLVGLVVAVNGLGLAADIGGWWLAKVSAAWVPMIAAGGFAYNGTIGLMMAGLLIDLWWPARRSA